MKKISSTNFENEQMLHQFCDAAYTLSLISGRWKITILSKLLQSDARFAELKSDIPAITERVLALQLNDLRGSGLINKVIPEGADKLITYQLSDLGRSIMPVIGYLANWGKQNK